jgi:transcriptional regulator with XRE-family HTH domain
MKQQALARAFAHRLKTLRQARQMSTHALAVRAGMKRRQDIEQLESGEHCPNLYTALMLAMALGVPLSALVPRTYLVPAGQADVPRVMTSVLAHSSVDCGLCGEDALDEGLSPSFLDYGC